MQEIEITFWRGYFRVRSWLEDIRIYVLLVLIALVSWLAGAPEWLAGTSFLVGAGIAFIRVTYHFLFDFDHIRFQDLIILIIMTRIGLSLMGVAIPDYGVRVRI